MDPIDPLADLTVPAPAADPLADLQAPVQTADPLADLQVPAASAPSGDPQAPGLFVRDGQTFHIPVEQTEAAIAEGYQPATPEALRQLELQREHGGFMSQVGTGLEGAAQGLTMGLYGLAADQLTPEYAQEMRERAETNPTSAMVGEGLGAVGGALLMPVGAGIRAAGAAKAATQAGAKAVMTRMAAEALAGAAEAGLQGTVSRAAQGLTGDAELDLENVLIGGLKDAALGAALGGGIQGASEGLSGIGRIAVQAVDASNADQLVDEVANKAAFKMMMGNTSKRHQRLANERHGGTQGLGKWINDNDVIDPLGDLGRSIERVDALRQQSGRRLEALVQRIDEAGVTPDLRVVADRIQKEVIDPKKNGLLDHEVGTYVQSKLARMLDEMSLEPGTSADLDTFEKVWRLRQQFDGLLQRERIDVPAKVEALREAREVFEDAFVDLADDVAARSGGSFDAGRWANDWRNEKRFYSQARFVQDMALDGLAARQANRSVSLTDTIMGASGVAGTLASGNLFGLLSMPVVLGGVNNIARTRGPGVLANVLSAKKGLGGIPSLVQKGRKAIQKASDDLLDSVYRATPVVTREGPDEAGEGINAGIPDEPSLLRTLRAARDVSEGHGDPTVSDAISDLYGPRMADAYDAAQKARADFLTSKLDALGKGPRSRLSLARYVRAVDDPAGAVKRIAVGTATKEDVEALQALYPRTLSSLAFTVQQRLARSNEAPDRRALARLSRQLGVALTPAQDRARVAQMQALWRQGEQPGQQGAPSSGGSSSQAPRQANTAFGDRAMTQTQRVRSSLG